MAYFELIRYMVNLVTYLTMLMKLWADSLNIEVVLLVNQSLFLKERHIYEKGGVAFLDFNTRKLN